MRWAYLWGLAGLLPLRAFAESPEAPGIAAKGFVQGALAVVEVLAQSSSRAALQLAALGADLPDFPATLVAFFARLGETGFSLGALVARVVLWLAVGALAELGFRAMLAKFRKAAGEGGRGLWLLGNLAAMAVFAVVGGWPLLMSVQANSGAQSFVVSYMLALVMVRVFALLARLVLAPWRPALRLAALSDPEARRLYRHLVTIAGAAVFFLVTTKLLRAGGLSLSATLTFALITRTLVAVAVIAAIFAHRAPIARILSRDRKGRRRAAGWQGLAGIWHLLATSYVALSWGMSSMLLLLGRFEANTLAVASLILIVALVTLCLMLDDWAARADAATPATTLAAVAGQRSPPSFAQFFSRLGRALATVGTLTLLVRLWSGPWDIWRNPLAEALGPALTQLMLTLLIAYVLWQVVAIGSERMLCAAAPGASARQTRVATFLPLIRNTTFVAIALTATMIGLSAIGVDVLPLLAGAGVVGIALGMGGQALVKDIVSGIFFLLDDAFRVGEYVDTGLAEGTIERAGIRSLAIRHPLGALHTVPFGEIRTIANHSRDWISLRLDFRLPFDTDLALLQAEFEQLAEVLAADPQLGPLFVGRLDFGGVVMIDEGAMIVRTSYKCLPGEQYRLRRIVYDAVQKMFQDKGISVAVREVRVRGEGAAEHGPATSAGSVAALGSGQEMR
ncbi:small-conductance mechanosensitive channel [Rhodobacter sp. JA431]|uniref:mechanosensitive ion channel domain-containing protein n=1 Tax=Rhodobacter sp. JA431 TaxID=570013 RepID=UPI000BCF26B3|nr:mechanosensitive ion channel domain-containing protein [Rhodobacter sp. JA431]SOC21005.1 small-conductance mechanosensitive channel [Rhodobacter sp. JA431]